MKFYHKKLLFSTKIFFNTFWCFLVLFSACEISTKKNNKNYKTGLMTSFILLLNISWTWTLCFSSKFVLRIPSVLSSFLHTICSALSSLFPIPITDENLLKSLKQWNALVGIKSATLIIEFMTLLKYLQITA